MLSGPERVVKALSGPLLCHGSAVDLVNRMRMPLRLTASPPTGYAPPWPLSRRPRGGHFGRQDRGSPAVGLRSVPVGGSGGRVFAAGRGEWRSSAESRAGVWGELNGRENKEESRPVMEPAPLLLESRWLDRVRPACEGDRVAAVSSGRKPAVDAEDDAHSIDREALDPWAITAEAASSLDPWPRPGRLPAETSSAPPHRRARTFRIPGARRGFPPPCAPRTGQRPCRRAWSS